MESKSSHLLNGLAFKQGYEKSELFHKYLKALAFEKRIPLVGTFELTPRCTLDCTMCYVHLNESQMLHSEIGAEQWISLIDEACDSGMLYAVLTGGECLLYPGFKKIYEHLQSRGVFITVLTNGTLLNEEMAMWIAERRPERVQISVYGSSPEGYKNVTGNAEAFYKVDKAIDLLIEFKIPFNLAVTVSKQMVPDFENILRYCNSKKEGSARVNSCPFESREETKRTFTDFAPSLEEQVEVFKIQRRILEEGFIKSSDEAFFEEHRTKKQPNLPETGIVCMAGRYGFSINWDGKMLPCSTFDFAGCFPFDEGFSSAWQNMNKKCIEYRNPVECIGCDYYGTCRFCPSGHYMKVGEGRANPDVCAEGRRMVKENIRTL